jgi:uncharacterized membrane protein YhfC
MKAAIAASVIPVGLIKLLYFILGGWVWVEKHFTIRLDPLFLEFLG